MPKLSLKRRHRQLDLSSFRDGLVDNTLDSVPTARKVSDDDIQFAPLNDPAKTVEPPSNEHSPSSRIPRVHSSKLACEGLSELDHPAIESANTLTVSCLSPTERRTDGVKQHASAHNTPSPWGQFVDMVVVPVSPSEDSVETTSSSNRFLPFCPSPHHTTTTTQHHNPYSRPPRPRLRGRRSASNNDKNLEGFVLHIPIEQRCLEEAQDAFQGLSV